MDEAVAQAIVERFLVEKAKSVGEPLAIMAQATQRFAKGWAFFYQSRSYLETGAFSEMLVGHGPVIVLDDGRILEGSSLDRSLDDVLRRCGEEP